MMLRLALQQRRPVWARASSSSLLSALDQQRCMSSETKLVKRKVALVAAYLGTGYHGVQLNENVSTIEDDLRQAIFKAGAMRESNFVDLRKIDWSRSSRTDKGVHAGCIVFSGKLLIDEEKDVDPDTGRVRGLAERLNESLPDMIRIFSATRVNKRFAARKNCVLREYEYFMPLSFLEKNYLKTDEPLNVEQAVEQFCSTLRRYEGIHDFHNFTKARSFFYKVHAKVRAFKQFKTRAQQDADAELAASTASSVEESEQDEEEEGEDNEDEEEEEEDASNSDEYAVDNGSQFEGPDEISRKLLPRHRRAVYSCTGSLIKDFYGEPYLRVHIVGQAFLLNQIRCMVGGALAVATKGMSRTAFDAALDTNRIVRVPIAPAEGLILLSSSFGGKLHTVSLYEDSNTQLAKERKGLSHRTLLTQAEDDAMTAFRENFIYKEVKQNWNAEGDLDRWGSYLERVYDSNAKLDDEELTQVLADVDAANQERASKRHNIVRKNRIDLVEREKPRAMLPKQFTTKLCVRYAVAPGIFTSDLRRGVSKHLRLGNLPLDADENAILQYIDSYGVKKMAEEGRKLRLSIRT